MTGTAGSEPSLSRDGDVYVLDLGDGENRFNPDRNQAIEEALAEVVGAKAPRALVTSATGKVWSNGLDLEWFQANQDRIQEAVDGFERLLAAFLGAGVPTAAAIQGHCFAGGAMLALTHDFAVMREDRGYFCLPEADLGLPFTPGMNGLILDRLPRRTAHQAMVTGARYGGGEAAAEGVVDRAAPEDRVLELAVERVAGQAGKNPEALGAIKRRMYAATIDALETSHPVGT